MARYTGSHSAPPKHTKVSENAFSNKRVRSQNDFASSTKRDTNDSYQELHYNHRKNYESRSNSVPIRMKLSAGKKISRFLLVILALFLAAAVGVVGVLLLFSHGPSEQLTKLFVRTFCSTGTKKWVPGVFMSEPEISAALDATIDTSYLMYGNERESIVSEVIFEEPSSEEETIELIDVVGANWRGKMYIVRDPSLVKFSAPDPTPQGTYGTFMLIKEYCDKYGAIGGITGGGFVVDTGNPYGFVIIDGKVVSCVEGYGAYVGITADHRLVTAYGDVQNALDRGVVDACVYGPILIQEGVKATGLGGGFSARSAIGQCADGTMLLLVAEERSLRSLGASYQDIADFLFDQGCINAINLDSGRSAVLVYNGENATNISIGAGIATEERKLPNAFVVLPEGSNG